MESLLSPSPRTPQRPESSDAGASQDQAERSRHSVRTIPVQLLSPNPHQPRLAPDESGIAQLAESLAASGILQPILVRPIAGGYQIIAGERRFQAARMLGWAEVPAMVRDASDEEMLEIALVENIHREDLNAIDRARAYRDYCERFGATPERLATRLGEDRTTVVNYLRILELPESVKKLVASKQLSMGHARCILGVDGDEQRERLAERILLDQLSVRAAEALVRDHKASARSKARDRSGSKATPRPQVESLQRRFESALGTKVQIIESAQKGRGRIVIEYQSFDDFDRIAARLGISVEED